MSDPARAVFSIFGKGTAVAISEDLLVTCEHVVKDAKEVTLFSHHPVFEGETDLKKRKAKGKVLATDEKLDLALLRSSSGRLPFLELEDGEVLDNPVPPRVWSWPGWNAWWEDPKKGIKDLSSTLTPTPYAAVMTNSWTEEENNTLQFTAF